MRKIFLVLMAAIVLFGGCSFVPEYLRPSGEKIVSPNFVVERITVCEELKGDGKNSPWTCEGSRDDELANDLAGLFEETLMSNLKEKGVRPLTENLPVQLLAEIAQKRDKGLMSDKRIVYIVLTMKLPPDLLLSQSEAGNAIEIGENTVKIAVIGAGALPLPFLSVAKEKGVFERRVVKMIAANMAEKIDKYFAAVAVVKSGKKA